METLISLYLYFFKIGALAFGGGYAILPLIQQYIVDGEGWLTMTEFTDLVSISQMTPGPIAMNAATFVGAKVAGIPGSMVATIGVASPQLIIMMILGYFLFSKKKKIKILDQLLKGIKPGVIGLILIAAISMFQNSLFPQGYILESIQIPAAICFIIGLVAYYKKVNLIKLIGLGAVLGIIITSVMG